MWRNPKYSDELLSQVKNDLYENILTVWEISNKYNIPTRTIGNYFWWIRRSLPPCANTKKLSNNWKKQVKLKELKTRFNSKWLVEIYESNYFLTKLNRIWLWWNRCFVFKG